MKIKIVIILFGLLFLLQGCGMMGGHLFHGENHVTNHRMNNNQ